MNRTAVFVASSCVVTFVFVSCHGVRDATAEGTAPGAGRAEVRVATETITTYPFGDPDPVPILAGHRGGRGGSRIYPYFPFDGYSTEGQPQDWTVVRMANPYIEVTVLPQVGGKVWGAVERSTGREFVYTNHVLKFRDIAMRGPWTSGGIEFNFGVVGHAPATATPVDYLVRENPDGSVSCVVGTIDLPSRTRWSVTVTVPADRASFETEAFWYNPTALHQAYYSWSNGAVRVGDDLEYAFPGRHWVGHGDDDPLRPWPVDERGRDRSGYAKNDFGGPKSYFTLGEFAEFYGGYWHDAQFGFGHWARYDDMPGRKVWIWGLARDGMIWEDLLTDSDGQYTEPQAGRLFNQSDHGSFQPGRADSWREVWFPYKDIGPMVAASPEGVLAVNRNDGSLEVALCALDELDDDLVVRLDGREIHRGRVHLSPMEVHREVVPVVSGAVEVDVGRTLTWSSDPDARRLRRPLRSGPGDVSTTEGLFLAASRWERERDYARALRGYLQCIERDPAHVRARCRAAELCARRAEWDQALDHARRALELASYDADANFIYGCVARQTGALGEAMAALGLAARSTGRRAVAHGVMAEIACQQADWALALEYARRALDSDRYHVNAHQVTAIAQRKLGDAARAREALGQLLAIEPLHHLARFEHALLAQDRRSIEAFTSAIRSELRHETFLEVALDYERLGLRDEAVQVLELAPEQPTVLHWLAYLTREVSPSKSVELLRRAGELSPALVFPFRTESIPVLEWACTTAPANDWKARYYLALIHWHLGRVEEAAALLEDCGERPDFAPFYLARAFLQRGQRPDPELADFRRALEVDRSTWRGWHHLIRACSDLDQNGDALALAREAAAVFPDQVAIRLDLVRCLMAEERFGEALALLERTVVLPAEGAREVHGLFEACQVELALTSMRAGEWGAALDHLEASTHYPEHLGTGRPFDPDLRLQQVLMSRCHESAGDPEAAEQALRAAYRYTLDHWGEPREHDWFGGFVLRHFGESEKAGQLSEADEPPANVLRALEGRTR